jgi:hypothetical protein
MGEGLTTVTKLFNPCDERTTLSQPGAGPYTIVGTENAAIGRVDLLARRGLHDGT